MSQKTVQKFAFTPRRVWDMRYKEYRYIWIWFSWYWERVECKKEGADSGYSMLNTLEPMYIRCKVKTNNNFW